MQSVARSFRRRGWTHGLPVIVLLAACSREATTGPNEAPALAKGGTSGGTTTTGIMPAKLGNPKDLGCSSTYALGLNSAASVQVVGQAVCGGQTRIFFWSSTTGPRLLGKDTATANAIAGDGASVGWWTQRTKARTWAFFFPSGGTISALPLPSDNGTQYAQANDISEDGGSAVGFGEEGRAFLWTRSTGPWTGPEILPANGSSAVAASVSDGGGTVAGTQGNHATVWTRSGGQWIATQLPTGDQVREGTAKGINRTGTVLVGFRSLPLPSNPATFYDEHVTWVKDGTSAGGWRLEPLPGTGVNEGRAYAVAGVNGVTTVAGYSWEDTVGPGGTMWAVVWRQQANGHFGTPQRLQPLSTGWSAQARNINGDGVVVGTATTRSGASAVMWRLP